MNTIFYLLRTGCPWRYLPRDGLPPRSTVYNIFRKFPAAMAFWRRSGRSCTALRERLGQDASPTASR